MAILTASSRAAGWSAPRLCAAPGRARIDLGIRGFRRAGIFGVGGTVDELRHWLTDAGLIIDRLQPSGALALFTATAAR